MAIKTVLIFLLASGVLSSQNFRRQFFIIVFQVLFSSADFIDQINQAVTTIQSYVQQGRQTVPALIDGYLSSGRNQLNQTIQKFIEDVEPIQKSFDVFISDVKDDNFIVINCAIPVFFDVYITYYQASLQLCFDAYQKQLANLQIALLAKYESYLSDAEAIASQVDSCVGDLSCQESVYKKIASMPGEVNANMGSKTRILQSWYTTGNHYFSTCLDATEQLLIQNLTSFGSQARLCASMSLQIWLFSLIIIHKHFHLSFIIPCFLNTYVFR